MLHCSELLGAELGSSVGAVWAHTLGDEEPTFLGTRQQIIQQPSRSRRLVTPIRPYRVRAPPPKKCGIFVPNNWPLYPLSAMQLEVNSELREGMLVFMVPVRQQIRIVLVFHVGRKQPFCAVNIVLSA